MIIYRDKTFSKVKKTDIQKAQKKITELKNKAIKNGQKDFDSSLDAQEEYLNNLVNKYSKTHSGVYDKNGVTISKNGVTTNIKASGQSSKADKRSIESLTGKGDIKSKPIGEKKSSFEINQITKNRPANSTVQSSNIKISNIINPKKSNSREVTINTENMSGKTNKFNKGFESTRTKKYYVYNDKEGIPRHQPGIDEFEFIKEAKKPSKPPKSPIPPVKDMEKQVSKNFIKNMWNKSGKLGKSAMIVVPAAALTTTGALIIKNKNKKS